MGKFHRSVKAIALFSLMPFLAINAAEIIDGKISRNVDGDTVWVKLDDKDETLKIRMMEIDAPEWHVVTPNGTFGQGTFGERSGNFLSEISPVGTEVSVKAYGKDTYGRTLGVILSDGEDINLEMVEAGWAIPYVICEGKECSPKYFKDHSTKEYLDACDRARKGGKGIFDPEDPLTEMPFEFRLRVQEREPDKYVGDFVTKKYVKPNQYKKVDLCRRIFFLKEKDAKNAGFTAAN